LSQGGYEAISRKLFRGVHAQRLLLEYDDARSGSFEPLRDVPEDKFVVLGLVTSKKSDLEPIEVLIQRIEEASRYVSPDRLGLSPQCGFASSIMGNRLSPQVQKRKLDLVVNTAKTVWP
jgi:5-methyltetrahydropteroyltriglutamate--homocysteine methyltransferase